MAARQKETRHVLDDGFVVAWDSSEIDEKLRDELIEIGSKSLGIVIGGEEATVAPSRHRRRKASRRSRSRAA